MAKSTFKPNATRPGWNTFFVMEKCELNFDNLKRVESESESGNTEALSHKFWRWILHLCSIENQKLIRKMKFKALLDKNRIKAKKKIIRLLFERWKCVWSHSTMYVEKMFTKVNEIQRKSLYMHWEWRAYTIPILLQRATHLWWRSSCLVVYEHWTLNMYDLENSLLDGEIESFICHNFNVALSPVSRFFLFHFSLPIFFLEIVLFSCGKKGHQKINKFFYSNTNLLGFRPSQIAATDFFYLSVCQVDLDAIVIVEVVSGVRRLCRFALVFSFFFTFSYSSRVWFRSFKKTKKKSLVKIVFFCETYNVHKMSNTCSFYGQHPWRWIKHSGYRKYAFIAENSKLYLCDLWERQ